MNAREREICARVRQFREAIKWSQSDFAKQLGISRDRLAGIEYFRTPLHYAVAWNIRFVFGVSLGWLADRFVHPDQKDLDPWPDPDFQHNGRLFSEVDDSLWLETTDKSSPQKHRKKAPLHAPQRSTLFSLLKDNLEDWMSRVPDDKTLDFSSTLFKAAEDYLDKLPKESSSKIDLRRGELVFDAMRLSIAKRMLETSEKKPDLTETSKVRNNAADMKSALERLLEDTRKATKARGMKAKLADALGVPQARLSEWLAGKYAPAGEAALRLRELVDDPDCWLK